MFLLRFIRQLNVGSVAEGLVARGFSWMRLSCKIFQLKRVNLHEGSVKQGLRCMRVQMNEASVAKGLSWIGRVAWRLQESSVAQELSYTRDKLHLGLDARGFNCVDSVARAQLHEGSVATKTSNVITESLARIVQEKN